MEKTTIDKQALVGEVLPKDSDPQTQRIFDKIDPKNSYWRERRKRGELVGPVSSDRKIQLNSITVEQFISQVRQRRLELGLSMREQQRLLEYLEPQKLRPEKSKKFLLSIGLAILIGGACSVAALQNLMRSEAELSPELYTDIVGGNSIEVTPQWLIENSAGSEPTEETTALATALMTVTPTVVEVEQDQIPETPTEQPISHLPIREFSDDDPNGLPIRSGNESRVDSGSIAWPTQTAPATEEPIITAHPTEQVTTSETEQSPTQTPTVIETQIPDTEIEAVDQIPNFVEWAFGGELFDAVVQARELQVGLRQLEEHPEGSRYVGLVSDGQGTRYEEITPGVMGGFWVRPGVDRQFWYLFDPETVVESLGGASQVTEQLNAPRITFFISGLDRRPGDLYGHSDGSFLISLDIHTGAVSVISFARDLLIPEVRNTLGRVNDPEFSLISWVYRNDAGRLVPLPPEFSRFVVENACACFVDGMMQFNFEAVAGYIDTLFPNGVRISLPNALHDEEYPTDDYGIMTVDFSAGDQVLNGEQLVQIMRIRHGEAGDDISRQERQRLVLEAIMRELMNTVKGQIRAGDLQGAYATIQDFFSVTQDTLDRYEQQQQSLLSSGSLTDATEDSERSQETVDDSGAYVTTFGGVSPQTLLAHVNNLLSDPANVVRIIGSFATHANDELLSGYQDGSSIVTAQISYQDVDTAAGSYVGFWAPARRRIQELFGGGV